MESIKVEPNLRELPSIDELLRTGTAQRLMARAGNAHLTAIARGVVDDLRAQLREPASEMRTHSAEQLLAAAATRLEDAWQTQERAGVRRVINATGVIIHTNLGRAPLSENARRAIADAAADIARSNTTSTPERGASAENTPKI